MASPIAPSLARWLRSNFKMVTVSFFIGFGLTACFGGDDTADEPVASSEEQPQAAGDEATAEAAPEAAPAADTETAAQPAGNTDAAPAEESMPGEAKPEAVAEAEAPPPEVMDNQSETVKAELTADQNVSDSPGALPVDTGDGANLDKKLEPEPAITTPAPSSMAAAAMPAGDSGTVSSPGAAKYIKGKHEKSSGYTAAGAGNSGMSTGGGDASYVVQHGDTLSTISQKIYGNQASWHSLAEINGMSAPFVIHPGDEVKYDSTAPVAKSFAKHYHGSMKTLIVKQGDTLSGLAQEVYGTAFAWKQLLSYNKGKISNPNHIMIGMRLAYAGGSEAVAADEKSDDKPKVVTKHSKGSAKIVNKTDAKPHVKKVSAKPKAAEQEAPISAEDLGE